MILRLPDNLEKEFRLFFKVKLKIKNSIPRIIKSIIFLLVCIIFLLDDSTSEKLQHTKNFIL